MEKITWIKKGTIQEMISRVRKKIEQFHMLEKGERVLIGLSGGSDSVCLAQILVELRKEYDLTLGAVCCHHGIRGEEADEDVSFAEAFCRERDISFFTAKEDVEKKAKEERLSVEEAGRLFRYDTFEKIMEKEEYNKLAVAHHGDDRAETMLFHLARGTGIGGLSTMEAMRPFGKEGWLIRPLLWSRKKEMEEWLLRKNLSWREDASNQEDFYSRNKVRHHILPVLSEINDRAVEHMGETGDRLLELYSYIKEETDSLYASCVKEEEGKLILNIPFLKKLHPYMQKEIFYKGIAHLAGGKKDITSVHVDLLLNLLFGGSGKECMLLKGIRAKRVYDSLILLKEEEKGPEADVEDALLRYDIFMEKEPYTGQKILKNECTKQFDCDKIMNELCLRYWQPGDYLYLREEGGKKKLGRYFIDAKIPPEERGKIPLLADGNHILWIVGHRISAYYKVTERTKEMLSVTIKNKG